MSITEIVQNPYFLLIAGSASILAFLALTIGYTRKKLREFKENLENAERDFDERISKLKATGGSVSARTDLGFLVLFELGTFRDSVRALYSMAIIAVLISILSIVIYSTNIIIEQKSLPASFICLVGYAGTAWLFTSIILMITGFRAQMKIWKYVRRIKEVWVLPVEKRMPLDDSNPE